MFLYVADFEAGGVAAAAVRGRSGGWMGGSALGAISPPTKTRVRFTARFALRRVSHARPAIDARRSRPRSACRCRRLRAVRVASGGRDAADARVVNGTDAEEEQFPYQVSLQYAHRHFCGGSIVAPRWVLTAAHCFDPAMQLKLLGVHAGTTDISRKNGSAKGVERGVVGVAIHQEYMPYNGHFNDIALIQVDKAFEWSDVVKAVQLPRRLEETVEFSPVTVTGWGMNYTGSPIMTKLQMVDIEVVSDADCLKAYGGDIHPSNICAGTPEGGKNACIGDSGGPLVADSGAQVGVVSWSVIPCAKKGFPVVYTQVSHYVDWIELVTGGGNGDDDDDQNKNNVVFYRV